MWQGRFWRRAGALSAHIAVNAALTNIAPGSIIASVQVESAKRGVGATPDAGWAGYATSPLIVVNVSLMLIASVLHIATLIAGRA